jgi:hypothetical protein
MRVLVACEFSGVVREAFRKRGHDAWSCDLVPAFDKSPYHFQQDVFQVIPMGWDLMIAHPPCTYLSVMSYCRSKEPGRAEKSREAFDFAMRLFNSEVKKIAMENPRGRIEQWFRRADQIIQPCEFGHDETKATCLWLKNLPPLFSRLSTTWVAPKAYSVMATGRLKAKSFVSMATSRAGMTRQQVRSKTFDGIADAMAEQWG